MLIVGKYEYREFCNSFIVINEQCINLTNDREAIIVWLDKDIKFLAMKKVDEEKAQQLAISKRYVVQVIDKDSDNFRYYHLFTISFPKLEILDKVRNGVRI